MDIKEELEKLIIKSKSPEELKEYENFKKLADYAGEAIKSIGSPLNIGNYLMSLALDRVEPIDVEGVIELFGAKTFDEKLTSFMEENTQWLRNMPMEDVEIKSIDGLKLVGHIIKAKKQERVLVAVHGWRSAWYRDFCFLGKYFYEHGITVLYVEQRAQGASEGDYMSFGVFERFDVIDWAEFAAEKFGKRMPVYLMGVSMGAASVMMSSSYKFPENVKGIIADCGYTSLEDIWKHVAIDCLHIPYPEQILNRLCYEKIHINPGRHNTISALEKATVPLLFVHGENDSFVPMENTILNYNACTSKKMIMLVPGAEHGLSSYVDPQRYTETLNKFFDKCE